MQTFLLLALSATASAYIGTPYFFGGKVGQSAALSRSSVSDFGLRLRQGNAARLAPSQIQMMAAVKKKSVSDLTRRDLEGKKVRKCAFLLSRYLLFSTDILLLFLN